MEMWRELLDDKGDEIFAYGIKPILIILAAAMLLRLSNIFIAQLAKNGEKDTNPLRAKRWNTISGLLKNVIKYVVYFVAAVTVLDCYQVPVMAILSTVGVAGVALAFGAQSLCRDIITGFFILMEDQYFVGEYIEAQGVEGYVEQFTIRCTYLRNMDGRLHIIPNGSMGLVTNHHRGDRKVMVEVGVAYEADSGRAIRILQGVCDEVNREFAAVIREPVTALGIVDLAASAVVIRMLGKAETMRQWEIERALRKKALEALGAAGVSIPYPHTQVIVERKKAAEGQDA